MPSLDCGVWDPEEKWMPLGQTPLTEFAFPQGQPGADRQERLLRIENIVQLPSRVNLRTGPVK